MKKLMVAMLAVVCLAVEAKAACVVGDKLPPAKINIAVVSATVGDTGVMFTFVAPTDPSGLGRYQIKVSTTGISDRSFATAPASANQPLGTPSAIEVINVPGLLPNTKYYLAAKAVDGCGNVATLMSNAVSFTTLVAQPPPPPPTTKTVSLSWDYMPADASPGSTLLGYKIKYGTTSMTAQTFTAWEYTADVVGLQNGGDVIISNNSTVPVYFAVTALYKDASGLVQESAPSNEVRVN